MGAQIFKAVLTQGTLSCRDAVAQRLHADGVGFLNLLGPFVFFLNHIGILFTVKDQVESYALILLLLLGRSRKAAAVAAAAVENVVEPLVDGGKRLAQAGEQLAQHAPALPSSPSAAVEAAVSVAKGAAVSIEEHLPNASEGLRLAEKAALSVGRDVVQKLAG